MLNLHVLPTFRRQARAPFVTLLTRLQEEFDFGDHVDVATFEQILEMDDGEDEDSHEFSKSIVFGYFEQAKDTFNKMDEAV